ncbi:hypothetical protein MIND_00699900 [Mycena indigotica]|uniref:Cytochrome c oxidase subunit 8, mitochondrial n=1 Tax=Mycena indigotica TaxID=2126181 RepID=A0A8H6SN82_9AGAR|nr:uncharacterized protein MIND_00699900 [Mycena indigotica]KAF7301347.1 hypothetical protein MIND_00699900 [Mycena indigotica]
MLARVVARPAIRQLHTTARLRSGHGDYNHLPFKVPFQGAAATPFGLKMIAFLSFGFAVPFVAVKLTQLKRGA